MHWLRSGSSTWTYNLKPVVLLSQKKQHLEKQVYFYPKIEKLLLFQIPDIFSLSPFSFLVSVKSFWQYFSKELQLK